MAAKQLCIAIAAVCGSSAGATVPYSNAYTDYLSQLKVADQYVQKKKAKQANLSGALSSSVIRGLYGRFYQVGDQWDVAAFQEFPSQVAGNGHVTEDRPARGRTAVFHYEVTAVKTGISPEVSIRVTQRQAFGVKLADPNVQDLVLTMSDRMTQDSKSYLMKGGNERVAVSPNGLRSPMTPLELYPLDVPEMSMADEHAGVAPVTLPDGLPSGLRAVAELAGYEADPQSGRWFELADLFGRPIDVLWRSGEPWPAYMKTGQGVAILIAQGAS